MIAFIVVGCESGVFDEVAEGADAAAGRAEDSKGSDEGPTTTIGR